MDQDTGLVVTVVTGLVLAFGFGFLATRLRLPPLVGYLMAGIAAGPSRRASTPTRRRSASSPRSA